MLTVLRRASAVILLLLATHAQAEVTSFRSYSLAPHGILNLGVPSSWNDQMRQRSANIPPTILFTPERGYAFNVQLTPIWPASPDAVVPDMEQMVQEVQKAADDAKASAVDSAVSLHEIHGAQASSYVIAGPEFPTSFPPGYFIAISQNVGYYFSITDRDIKPDEFKYLTQGMLRVGYLVVTFTIVSNDESGSPVIAALKMLRGARQEFPKP